MRAERIPSHTHALMGHAGPGGKQAHENMPPYQALHFIIALQGVFPSEG